MISLSLCPRKNGSVAIVAFRNAWAVMDPLVQLACKRIRRAPRGRSSRATLFKDCRCGVAASQQVGQLSTGVYKAYYPSLKCYLMSRFRQQRNPSTSRI
jgi:hypothetical protein